MAPRPRPLKLPLSAFSAPPPAPASSSVEATTVDAHVALDVKGVDAAALLEQHAQVKASRKVVGAVGVTRSSVAPSAHSPLLRVLPIHPIPCATPYALPSDSVIEFEVIQPPSDESAWDEIDRVLDSIVKVAREVDAPAEGSMEVDGVSAANNAGAPTVVLSNISPTLLPGQPFYQAYVRQLSALSLVPGVCLKLLPPTVLEPVDGQNVGWWEDEEALVSVLTQYLIPALDSFGSHRLLFGSSPVPVTVPSGFTPTPAIPSPAPQWYALVLRLLDKMKLDRESAGEILGGTAGRVYGLTGGGRA